jgi:hypothetical protein
MRPERTGGRAQRATEGGRGYAGIFGLPTQLHTDIFLDSSASTSLARHPPSTSNAIPGFSHVRACSPPVYCPTDYNPSPHLGFAVIDSQLGPVCVELLLWFRLRPEALSLSCPSPAAVQPLKQWDQPCEQKDAERDGL